MNDPRTVTARRVWRPWLHFNLWSFLLINLTISLLGWASDVDKYRDKSELFIVDVVPGTFTVRETMLLPHAFISEFQGVVAGETRFFAIFFYPSKPHRKPTSHHERIYALINVDEFKVMGNDVDHPIPVLKYGISPEMENFDYDTGDVNRSVLFNVYRNNVENYIAHNKPYWGVSIAALVRFLYLWISLPWGIGCLIYLTVNRAVRRRRSRNEPGNITRKGS